MWQLGHVLHLVPVLIVDSDWWKYQFLFFYWTFPFWKITMPPVTWGHWHRDSKYRTAAAFAAITAGVAASGIVHSRCPKHVQPLKSMVKKMLFSISVKQGLDIFAKDKSRLKLQMIMQLRISLCHVERDEKDYRSSVFRRLGNTTRMKSGYGSYSRVVSMISQTLYLCILELKNYWWQQVDPLLNASNYSSYQPISLIVETN